MFLIWQHTGDSFQQHRGFNGPALVTCSKSQIVENGLVYVDWIIITVVIFTYSDKCHLVSCIFKGLTKERTKTTVEYQCLLFLSFFFISARLILKSLNAHACQTFPSGSPLVSKGFQGLCWLIVSQSFRQNGRKWKCWNNYSSQSSDKACRCLPTKLYLELLQGAIMQKQTEDD